jgi:hypothetical protein
MAILDSLKGLFSRGRTIDDITLDELQREKIRLDQDEAKLVRQVEGLESQKKQLFLRGKDEVSERQQMIVARKITELDAQARNLDRQLQFISRQLRTINGFVQLKENRRALRDSGLISVLGRIDLEHLQKYVQDALVDGVFQMKKFEDIMGRLEDGQVLDSELPEEKGVLEIVSLMRQAKEAEASPEGVEDSYRQMNQLLTKDQAEGEAQLPA